MMSQSQPRVSPFRSTLQGVGSRRQERRYPLRARVEVLPLDGRLAPMEGITDDICHRGVFVRGELHLEIDSLVVLKIHTQYGKLKALARVVHDVHDIGSGFAFMDLTPEQHLCISVLISLSTTPLH
jgi:hypothetical protein